MKFKEKALWFFFYNATSSRGALIEELFSVSPVVFRGTGNGHLLSASHYLTAGREMGSLSFSYRSFSARIETNPAFSSLPGIEYSIRVIFPGS